MIPSPTVQTLLAQLAQIQRAMRQSIFLIWCAILVELALIAWFATLLARRV